MLPQLALICNEPLPADWRNAGRNLYNYFLDRAADQAESDGNRLALIVDGLDEDSGSPSIVSQLPKNPHPALRIILASRATPDIATDLDPAHPLRCWARISLSPSPQAHEIEQRAKAELRDLLSGDSIHRDLVGLITAARGGLTLGDLADLTGHDEYDIQNILYGRAGRVLTPYVVSNFGIEHQREPGYVLAHEELREQAHRHLRARDRLADYYRRIHTWAEGYGAAGWPPRTPDYLLTEYPGLLKELNDVSRLATLAVDEARHARLFERTGGDVIALTELDVVLRLLADAPEPDFVRMCMVARNRDAMTQRYEQVPEELICAWVRLGHVNRAIGAANSIRESYRREETLSKICAVLTETGQVNRAIELAQQQPDIEECVELLAGIIEALGSHGSAGQMNDLIDRAAAMAESISSREMKSEALAAIAEAVASTGNVDRTIEFAHKAIELAEGREVDISLDDSAQLMICKAASALGDRDRVVGLAKRLEGRLSAISETDGQIRGFIAISEALVGVGEVQRARAFAERAYKMTEAVVAIDSRDVARCHIAEILTSAGEIDRAIAMTADMDKRRNWANFTLESIARFVADQGEAADALKVLAHIEDGHYRDLGMIQLAAVTARRGESLRANEIARSIATKKRLEISVLSAMAEGAAEGGNLAWAEQLAAEATDLLDPRSGSADREALCPFIKTLASVGEFERAHRIAAIASEEPSSFDSKAALAIGMAAAGDANLALETVHKFPPYMRERAVSEIAQSAVHRGCVDVVLNHIGRGFSAIELLTAVAGGIVDESNSSRAIDALDCVQAKAAFVSQLPQRPTPTAEADWMINMARALARVGDISQAQSLLYRADGLINDITDDYDRLRLQERFAHGVALSGDFKRALAVAGMMPNRYSKLDAFKSIVGAANSDLDIESALEVVRDLGDDDYVQGVVLEALLKRVAGMGNADQALALAEGQASGSYERTCLKLAIAAVLARHGCTTRAVELADEIWAAERRSGSRLSSSGLAEVFALAGDQDRAVRAAREVSSSGGSTTQELVGAAENLAAQGFASSAAKVAALAWLGASWTAVLPVIPRLNLAAARTIADLIATTTMEA